MIMFVSKLKLKGFVPDIQRQIHSVKLQHVFNSFEVCHNNKDHYDKSIYIFPQKSEVSLFI